MLIHFGIFTYYMGKHHIELLLSNFELLRCSQSTIEKYIDRVRASGCGHRRHLQFAVVVFPHLCQRVCRCAEEDRSRLSVANKECDFDRIIIKCDVILFEFDQE